VAEGLIRPCTGRPAVMAGRLAHPEGPMSYLLNRLISIVLTLFLISLITFGVTNIITLDADRNVILDQRVLVKRDEGKVVNLLRGTDRQSYNCTPQCNPSITIGDDAKYFDAIRNASQNKKEFSEGGGDKSSQQGQ
jgi:hypothetical protein